MPENEKRPEKGEVRQYTVAEDDEGVRLDRWFKRHLPEVGFATVARWARTGQIRVDGARAKPDDRLTTGQVLRIPPGNPARAKAPPRRRELTEDQKAQARAMVIKETPNAIVLNKPPGLATQGGSKTFSHVDGLLDAWIFARADAAVRDVWAAGRHVVAEGRHRGRDAISERYRRTIDTLRAAI